jgi:uncharacterized alpha-E superfamily protein
MLSRVAESLFWIGRYIERAENNARLLDVNLQVTLDFEGEQEEMATQSWKSLLATLEDQELFESQFPKITAENVSEFLTFSSKNPNSIVSCVGAARENARTVRESISSEMWEQINLLHLWLGTDEARALFQGSTIDFYRKVVDGSHQFHGTTDATLTHGEGWNFLQCGKFIERADCASRILDLKYHILLPSGEEVCGSIDTVQWMSVLKSCSGFEAFRKLYPGPVQPWRVAEFIILHDSFPRSIRFCADQLDAALHRISGCDRAHFTNEAERRSGRLCSDLNYETIQSIFRTGLHEYLDVTQQRLIAISGALQATYCRWADPAPPQAQRQGQ